MKRRIPTWLIAALDILPEVLLMAAAILAAINDEWSRATFFLVFIGVIELQNIEHNTRRQGATR